MLLQQLLAKGRLTTREAGRLLDCDDRTALATLKKVAEHAPVRQGGFGRARFWEVEPIATRHGILDRRRAPGARSGISTSRRAATPPRSTSSMGS